MRLRLVVTTLFVAVLAPAAAHGDTLRSSDFTTVKLAGSDVQTEPRITVDKNDVRWVVSDGLTKDAGVYKSTDGGQSFTKLSATWTQAIATIDVDIVAMDLGEQQPRILASELDTAGLNFPTGYTDDGGKTWQDSRGSVTIADQDRQWFAVGPKDPITGKPRVYLLYHNLASGVANHNMYVATSLDGGETFLPPVPIAQPGSDAFLDLQCSDSGGPSNITVNQTTGRIYAFYTTRAAPTPDPVAGVADAGGCGASVFGPMEFNIVNGTRVWVASSPNGLPGTWTNSLAVDDSKTQQVVSMQLAYGALDTEGNVYVAYPESPKPYPDLTGTGVKLVWQQPDAAGNVDDASWSEPRTIVAPTPGRDGANLVHLAVGDPGRIAIAYYKAQGGGENNQPEPVWYTHVAQSLDAMSDFPHVTDVAVTDIPAYKWSASAMMGICSPADEPTPVDGVAGGLLCGRSTDVWGIALDKDCRVMATWPTTGTGKNDDGTIKGVPHASPGTYVTTQRSGPTLCDKDENDDAS